MKKLFLTSIAALLLATGTAHATSIVGFKCSDLYVDFGVDKDKDSYTTNFSIKQSYDDNRILRLKIVHPKEGGTDVYMNGKRCKTVLMDGREF